MKKLFGTDGIRGPMGVYPLTKEGMFGLASSVGIWLKKDASKKELTVILGRDTRTSGDVLEDGFSQGASSLGLRVIKVGIVPTPAVAFVTRKFNAHLGAIISASHNTKDDNGIKFFNSSGYKLSEYCESQIEEIMHRFGNKKVNSHQCLSGHREKSYIDVPGKPRSIPLQKGLSVVRGKIQKVCCSGSNNPILRQRALQKYIEFVKSSAEDFNLKGLKIAVDCGYGSTSGFITSLFESLGAKINLINDTPDGENINFKCGALYPEAVANLVVKEKADIGLSLDGDGDRVILSDEKGKILDGDYIMAILGILMLSKNALPRDTLVTTHMSNTGLDVAINRAGGRIIRTEVGDRAVVDRMLAEGLLFGGEQSGHIIFLNYSTTGDGLITSLQIMKAMLKTGKPLSMLARHMEKFPQVLVNVQVKEKKPLSEIPRFNKTISEFNSRLNNQGRVFVRYSGTEPLARIMVEGKDGNLINKIANSIAQLIREAIGCQS